MSRDQVSVRLISIDSQSLCASIREVLVRLGYVNVNIYKYHDVLSGMHDLQDKVFVLPLDLAVNSQQKIVSIRGCLQGMPVMCIIHAAGGKWQGDVLAHCNDFLCWPCSENEIAFRLERLSGKLGSIEQQADEVSTLEDFIGLNLVGNSPPFLKVLKKAKKVACCDVPVLIEGETGTGKEMTARAIHYLSERRDYPFIPVNCGAIPDSLLENELFGHQRGAYTDAKETRQGLISQAQGGTIFFDEVEAFSPKGQIVLLRFFQDQLYTPLGGEQKKANVRIIDASNANLSKLVEAGTFRRDLFYRLNIMSIDLPKLTLRGNDIELLAQYFLNEYKKQYNQPDKYLHPDSFRWMKSYSWPGNVRELENIIHQNFLLADGPCINLVEKTEVPQDRRKNFIDRRQDLFLDSNFNEAKSQVVCQFEKKYLDSLMRKSKGNVTQAAKLAGKERRSLGKLLKKHGIDKKISSG